MKRTLATLFTIMSMVIMIISLIALVHSKNDEQVNMCLLSFVGWATIGTLCSITSNKRSIN
jgi:tryptophan-rich sensory protein